MRFAQPTLAFAFAALLGAATIPATAAVPVAPVTGDATTATTATAATMASTANLRAFNTLLNKSGVTARLNRPAEVYTVFAPTNDAVAKVREDIRERLFRPDAPGLKHLVRSHLVAGVVNFDQLRDGAELKTLDGEIIRVAKLADGSVLLNGVYRVRDGGRATTNGMVYAIDTMIAPAN